MARLIGIDYGQKRSGLAVTDPGQRIAQSLAALATYDLYTFLDKYVAKEPVEAFVVGFPRQMNHQPSESAPHVQAFVKGLQNKFPDIPVYWEDERFTSTMASKALFDAGVPKAKRQERGRIDVMSAVILLESYLEKQRNLKTRT